MSPETPPTSTRADPTPEIVAQMLDVVADHSVEVALSDLEETLARLRAEEVEAREAREILRNTPAEVLREALRLRAAPMRSAR